MTTGQKKADAGYLAEEIERNLRASIESGECGVGDKLPTESVLGEKYGVSRTVVREAIAGLRASGFVVSRRGSGVFVRSREPLTAAGALFVGEWHKRVPDVIDVLELRSSVEITAAKLAAERASIGQVEEIHGLHRAFSDRALKGGQDAGGEDFAFHQGIAKATNNKFFEKFLSEMGGVTIPRTNLSLSHGSEAYTQYMAQLVAEHSLIIEAIERRDSEAAADAMQAHLLGSLSRYRKMSRNL